MLMHFFTCDMWEDVHFCVKLTDVFIHCVEIGLLQTSFSRVVWRNVVTKLAHIPSDLDSIPSATLKLL